MNALSSQLSGTGPVVESIRVPQVEEQLRTLEVNSDELSKMVTHLEASLSSVINPIAEKPMAPATPQPVLVPLADSIQTLCGSIRVSVDRLREINARIELPRP